ncbi:MAG: hypothetical protein JSR73_08850 [Proteobacteria bacterium]|nr:hypothetical protein [Pseudomonadota bacterium]
MSAHLGGLIELVVVFAFVLGIGVVELVALRYDRRRDRTPPAATSRDAASGTAATPAPKADGSD